MGKNRRAVLSNYSADVYETCQLWLERVKRSLTHLLQFFDFQRRFQITRVQSRTIAELWAKIGRLSPFKM